MAHKSIAQQDIMKPATCSGLDGSAELKASIAPHVLMIPAGADQLRERISRR